PTCCTVTNFKPAFDINKGSAAKLLFLNLHSKASFGNCRHALASTPTTTKLQQSRCAFGASSTSTLGRRDLFRFRSSPFTQEQLFDMVLTPFDVGKLNHLVIPKQHVEKALSPVD
ncbi:hypothetical protein Taro_009880, partial [Colocasia esculenta]|nr:hypothetical protein [Colocasia esculenta]